MSASLMVIALGLVAGSALGAQKSSGKVEDLTGAYDFLGPYDTLALLQEEGMVKGYIDVMQGQSESDVILSYPITIGSRQGDHVEFRTRKIHEKYYRFSGSVQRGKARKESQPDYAEIVGELQTITSNSVTGKETVERQQVVFKSKGEAQEQH